MPHRSHPLHGQLLRRRRRLKGWLRPLPRRANVGRYPVIKWFADVARRRPWLWSFQRREVMVSVYAGSVLALMPVYGLQVLIGLGLALWLRGNLTVMVALQMLTNPLTLGPIYYATHSLGKWLLTLFGIRTAPVSSGGITDDLGAHALALVVGGGVAGVALAVVVDVAWRLFAWEARRFRARWQAMRDRAAAAGED